MRFMRSMAAATACLLLLAAQAFAQDFGNADYVQDMDTGAVNWQTGYVTAKGIGVPPPNSVSLAQARGMAIRAATVDARRNLLSMIKGVQIDAQTTVQNAMIADDTVVERVRGFLQNSQILDTAYMSDGSVEVTVGMNLRGGLANALIPPETPFFVPGGSMLAPSPVPGPVPQMTDNGTVPAPGTEGPLAPAPENNAPFTGLLVDARGLGARPAMSPRLLDETGKEVYGTASVSREYAIQQGMAGYGKDMDKAAANPRVAGHPLVVKAVAVDGKARTNLVISNDDAAKLRELAPGQDFLEKCRVMIVLD
ncbi:LPP20 family lipoprotein [Desulfovibrio subterraneus]|jgi:hypothetical protein|uniref:LPP20 family lipoprotein n=1 Tax=Desulfovibrio subterraneus TaxID=2718620 RepID=UPI0022B8A0F3|nr:LPP20 family lipoprotein [Desulfovibrio subterraneus]WBF68347.1 LPP20 family lipoprotein [Desulfovibrio subterraneus]